MLKTSIEWLTNIARCFTMIAFDYLLKLFPVNNDANDQGLGCALEDCRLLNDLLHEALCFAWGQPIFSEVLHTHKGILKITENLALALRKSSLQR